MVNKNSQEVVGSIAVVVFSPFLYSTINNNDNNNYYPYIIIIIIIFIIIIITITISISCIVLTQSFLHHSMPKKAETAVHDCQY